MRSVMSPTWDVDRFFNDLERRLWDTDTTWRPAVDVTENKKAYVVSAELPGLKKDDIHISFENDMLILSGERKMEHEEKKDSFHRIERAYGKFERSFRLPDDVDVEAIKANYKNGVLTIEIPKSEKALPKQIEIK